MNESILTEKQAYLVMFAFLNDCFVSKRFKLQDLIFSRLFLINGEIEDEDIKDLWEKALIKVKGGSFDGEFQVDNDPVG